MSRTTLTVTLGALIAVIALSAAGLGSPALVRTVAEVFISVGLVVGLYIFIGNSGVLSFGHLGFMAAGAYVTAWVTMDPAVKSGSLPALPEWLLAMQVPGGVAMVIAACGGALFAALVGAILMRLSGVAASIASFAFLAIVYAFASNWTDGTGGTASLIGVPGFASLEATAIAAIGSICVAGLFDGSKAGVMLRATREDDVAANAMGIRAYAVRLIAFVLSAAVVAVAGSLHASFLGVVSPDAYFVDATFVALAMLVLGGLYSLEGAVLGTLLLSLAKQLLVALETGFPVGDIHVHIPRGSQELAVAVLICVVLVKRPRGLTAGLLQRLSRKARR